MKVLSEKKYEIAWNSFWKKVIEVGLNKYLDEETLKEQLKQASGGISEDSGVAYPGGLITHINITMAFAEKLFNIVSTEPFNVLQVDWKSLVKVILLMHLSKIEMYIPNDNSWEIEKRGFNFKFAELEGKLKFGERSILYANNNGIKLTGEEFEAIRCIDKKSEGTGSEMFDSALSLIVRQANELAYAFEKERNKK